MRDLPDSLYDMIIDFGVTYDRLHAALEQSDNWDAMVHSFEYLTVLGVVESLWPEEKR